jgi:polysaccharide export outer membrane protein
LALRHSTNNQDYMMKAMRRNFSLLLIIAAFTGCSTEVRRPDHVAPKIHPQPKLVTNGMSEEERLSRLEKFRSQPTDDFKLGRGDRLYISVYDEPDLTLDSVPVRPDGKISFPLIEEVVAENRTADEIRAEMTERLSKFLVEPKVSVIVKTYKSQQYTIIGQVVKPGAFPLDTSVSLTQALARSGGLSQGQFHATSVELADLSHAFISRKGEMLPIDFIALFRGGDLRYDISLRSGDYIYIPSGLSQEVYVLGEVNRADMFAFREGMSLSKALVFSEGFSRIANIKRIHVIRGSLTDPTLYVVNLDDIYNGLVTDVALRPGDIVYVPRTGLSKWSQFINELLPSFVLARTGTAF